ncbi:MAG TPA: tyrosine/phenylalanine carboxypeptidase domain-containing protein [Salinimicrobium sp.]|nr:tyrosine/phenylalanine carboxypeptidase domain-containing protein [Salinimicrobium sp.]
MVENICTTKKSDLAEIDEIKDINTVGTETIDKIIGKLENKQSIRCHLPGGGYLQVSGPLPYLLVYRIVEPVDPVTVRLILSESSYLIIGNKDFEGYSELIYAMADKMSAKFESFLVLEIFTGDKDSTGFKLKGPADKLPATLKEFKKELDALKNQYNVLTLQETVIENNEERHPPGTMPLLGIKELKESGALLLGLEIPPVYRNSEGEEYPVFFRSFKDDFVLALHKTIFQFIRIQTTSGISSYYALGQKNLQKNVLDIDRELTKIENSFQFLWLISPVNIRQVKDKFFESKYEELLNFHYRLLPIDPDVLKRKLYNLKIEEIDDPALSFLFREKREELELQITMLNDRGSKPFFYNSLMLYHGVEKELKEEALALLKEVKEEELKPIDNLVGAYEFKELAEKEFEYFRGQDENFTSKIHIRDDVNILMVSRGELYIPSDYKMDPTSSKALIQHEVGTHVLTYYNGLQQPLQQLSNGLTDYDTLQEGLAVMAEYFVGGLKANRMRTLAGRVIAASARMENADFKEIFNLLHWEHQFSPQRAFSITSRIMQGSGFIKDVIYLQGIVKLKKYIEKGGEIEPLYIGKFALKHLPIVTELKERMVLKDTKLLPRFLHAEETKEKINQIRKGISLSQLIST